MPRTVETVVYELEELPERRGRAPAPGIARPASNTSGTTPCSRTSRRSAGYSASRSGPAPSSSWAGGRGRIPTCFFAVSPRKATARAFEGAYSHARGAARAIRAHAPKDEELHRIATSCRRSRSATFFQLHGTIRTRGNYCHEHSMAIEVERDSPTWQPMTDGAEDTVIEALRDLARWLYRQLEREYDYLTSDDAVDESIAVNQYTFTAQGRRFG